MREPQTVRIEFDASVTQAVIGEAERLVAAAVLARAKLEAIIAKCVEIGALRERHEDALAIERLALDAIAALNGGQP